jgi:hypothetical protein
MKLPNKPAAMCLPTPPLSDLKQTLTSNTASQGGNSRDRRITFERKNKIFLTPTGVLPAWTTVQYSKIH